MGTLYQVISSVQSLTRVWLFATPWITAHQASLSITNSRSLLKLMPIESVMPSTHLILWRPLLLLPPIPPSIRVFSNESTLRMRWPKYWSFSYRVLKKSCSISAQSSLAVNMIATTHENFTNEGISVSGELLCVIPTSMGKKFPWLTSSHFRLEFKGWIGSVRWTKASEHATPEKQADHRGKQYDSISTFLWCK